MNQLDLPLEKVSGLPKGYRPGYDSVAIQGPPEGYHGEIARRRFGEARLLQCETFDEVVKYAIQGYAEEEVNGQTEKITVAAGVLAICSSNGKVGPVRDKNGTNMERLEAAEEYLRQLGDIEAIPVEFYLWGIKDARLQDIARILSQDPARAISRHWLEEHVPNAEPEEKEDGLIAARTVAEKQDPTLAAIANPAAENIVGLEKLSEDQIQAKGAATNFVVITKANDAGDS